MLVWDAVAALSIEFRRCCIRSPGFAHAYGGGTTKARTGAVVAGAVHFALNECRKILRESECYLGIAFSPKLTLVSRRGRKTRKSWRGGRAHHLDVAINQTGESRLYAYPVAQRD